MSPSWFGDYNSLCSSCIPLSACNLLTWSDPSFSGFYSPSTSPNDPKNSSLSLTNGTLSSLGPNGLSTALKRAHNGTSFATTTSATAAGAKATETSVIPSATTTTTVTTAVTPSPSSVSSPQAKDELSMTDIPKYCYFLTQTLVPAPTTPYGLIQSHWHPGMYTYTLRPPVWDVGTVVVSVLGIILIYLKVLRKIRRLHSAVGKTEMELLFFIFSCILFLQAFTVGGLIPGRHVFMMWVSAMHQGAIVCFFWTLLINALILFQFVEDGTKHTMQFILGTGFAWMVGVTFMALDLSMDITGHHIGYGPALYFMTLVFPVASVVVYTILVSILVFWKLDEYKAIVYALLSMVLFAFGQLILFGASNKIAEVTRGHVNGAMFSTILNIFSALFLYRFWRTIIDDTWGDSVP